MKLETTNCFKQLSKGNPDLIVLSDDEVKATQRVSLETLHDIIDICNKYHVNYHLTGGSALGVVRHKGFIPWDDDIDIDMDRKDVKIFFTEFEKLYHDKYWIHTPYSESRFCMPCYHIRRKNTIFRGCADPDAEESGIGVDILVMENTFNNKIIRCFHGYVSLALGLIVSCRRFFMNRRYLIKISEGNDDIRKIFRRKIQIGALVSFLPLNKWTAAYDKWNSLCHNQNSKYVTVATGKNHYFKELYLRSDFSETTTGTFEDLTVKIPKKYDDYLKRMYGDYMQIPPKNKQEQHVLVQFSINLYENESEKQEKI